MGGFLATVLICDDEPALRELVRASLDGKYAFAEADDGDACLEQVRRLRPDLVVLDLMMPRRGGLDVLAELRSDDELADIPVIILTAQPTSRDDALRNGATIVMDKPFGPDEISAAVEEVLSGRRE